MNEDAKRIEDLARMEEDHASSLSSSVEGLSNVLVQEILRGIAHDSEKHAGFYTAILRTLLEDEGRLIDEEEYDHLERVIEKHIEVETRMMFEVKQLLEGERDSRVRFLLEEIYLDEEKHHILMKRLLEIVIARETLFEEDLWDMIWKDVPGHGAPLG